MKWGRGYFSPGPKRRRTRSGAPYYSLLHAPVHVLGGLGLPGVEGAEHVGHAHGEVAGGISRRRLRGEEAFCTTAGDRVAPNAGDLDPRPAVCPEGEGGEHHPPGSPVLMSSHSHTESPVAAPRSVELVELLPMSKSPLRDSSTPVTVALEMFFSVMV